MMDDKSESEYLVVEFPEEDTDGAIPMALISSDWVIEQNGSLYCYWPNYFKSDLQKDRAIQNHSSLITEKCSLCPIVIKYNTADYQKAYGKLQRMEKELESETDSEIQKRKPKKKIYSDYEEDYSEDNLDIPVAPQPKKFTTLKNMEVKELKNNCIMKRNTPVEVSFTKGNDTYYESQHETRRHEPTKKNIPNTTSTNENIGLSNRSISIRNEKSLPCSGCEENKALLNELIRCMESMRDDVKYLMKLATKNENLQIFVEEFPQFNTIDDLFRYNEDLASENNLANACSRFQLIGGKDASETTRKILALMIDHNLALKMNWSGRNDKGGFKNLKNIINLIHVSVRKNPLAHKATLSDIENVIKVWLRNAPDREGGRTRRLANNN